MKSRLVYLSLLFILALCFNGCSSSRSSVGRNNIEGIKNNEPYSLNITTTPKAIESLLREYVAIYFGNLLKLSDSGEGSINLVFTSHDQANQYAKWQNSTALMIIKDKDGKRLWTSEYNYKGGMEMSSFTVSSPAEAGKLVIERLSKKFKSDFHLN